MIKWFFFVSFIASDEFAQLNKSFGLEGPAPVDFHITATVRAPRQFGEAASTSTAPSGSSTAEEPQGNSNVPSGSSTAAVPQAVLAVPPQNPPQWIRHRIFKAQRMWATGRVADDQVWFKRGGGSDPLGHYDRNFSGIILHSNWERKLDIIIINY